MVLGMLVTGAVLLAVVVASLVLTTHRYARNAALPTPVRITPAARRGWPTR